MSPKNTVSRAWLRSGIWIGVKSKKLLLSIEVISAKSTQRMPPIPATPKPGKINNSNNISAIPMMNTAISQ